MLTLVWHMFYLSLAQINKNYDQAIEMYKKCIQLFIIYFNLAACYEENL